MTTIFLQVANSKTLNNILAKNIIFFNLPYILYEMMEKKWKINK